MRRFSGRFSELSNAIARRVRAYIREGVPGYLAVAKAFTDEGFTGKIEKWVIDGVLSILGEQAAASISSKSVRATWLDRHWEGSPYTMRTLLAKMDAQELVARSVQRSLRDADNWRKTARSLTEDRLIAGDVAKYIKELEAAGRAMMTGDPDAYADYRRTLRVARANIERLAANGAPTLRLKAAYQSVVTAVESNSEARLDKAIKRAVASKARYNAERIARTEMSRAYGEAFKARMLDDSDMVGYRSVLSDRHVEFDICDYWADADLYGMGPGVFPKDSAPPYPYHPHCLCVLMPVYAADLSGGIDTERGAEYLASLDETERKKLLGREGAERFDNGEGDFRRDLRGYQEPQAVRTLDILREP